MMPVPFFGYNVDDGLFVGGGIASTRHGFRKVPYAVRDVFRFRFAARTGAFEFDYENDRNGTFRDWGVITRAQLLGPNYVTNFFGLGNETTLDGFDLRENYSYNYVRLSKVRFEFMGKYQLSDGVLKVGLFVQTEKLEETKNRCQKQ